ncbi:FK506 binding protein proline rotamase rapamycin-binding protein [Linnemannia zychae]|nr:FK506 binding protein proline rotamase rapamycin-binding protein [Linnemannia zychae]
MGVTKTVISPGNGTDFPKTGDTVVMHYVGTLADNSKFDSSRDRNKPFTTQIGVGRVIKGWDEAVPQMSVGEKAVLQISPDYGYGARGYPPVIPPNSDLTFEVELLQIIPQ